jgi:hypothetical protein
MTTEKITIKQLNDNYDYIGEPIEAIYYNPGEYTIETKNQYQRTAIPGLAMPITQFINGETQTLSLTLFFDTYEDHTIEPNKVIKGHEDVRKYTRQIVKLMEINPTLHHPPVCEFSWGKSLSSSIINKFRGVIDSCSQTYTMFLEDGTPVRAKLTLNISEYRNIKEQLEALRLESPDRTKYRVLKEGDSLWQMAFREYNDSKEWRTIARKNNIDFPRNVSPGTMLILPPLEGQ